MGVVDLGYIGYGKGWGYGGCVFMYGVCDLVVVGC